MTNTTVVTVNSMAIWKDISLGKQSYVITRAHSLPFMPPKSGVVPTSLLNSINGRHQIRWQQVNIFSTRPASSIPFLVSRSKYGFRLNLLWTTNRYRVRIPALQQSSHRMPCGCQLSLYEALQQNVWILFPHCHLLFYGKF